MKYRSGLPGRIVAMLLAIFIFSASAFAQNASTARITIHKGEISVIDALKEVEQQSGLSVGFNNSKLEGYNTSLDLDNADLSTSLNRILAGTGHTYKLEGNYIKIVGKRKHRPMLPSPPRAVKWKPSPAKCLTTRANRSSVPPWLSKEGCGNRHRHRR